MANLIYNKTYPSAIVYDEKKPMNDHHVMSFTELPPTPSSSKSYLIVNEKESIKDLDITPINSIEPCSSSIHKSYGTISERKSTANCTTISPNDEDTSLYLLWTHQLLQERGFKPSPLSNVNDDDDEDGYSVDSSITNLSEVEDSLMVQSIYFNQHKKQHQPKSWLSSWFPFC